MSSTTTRSTADGSFTAMSSTAVLQDDGQQQRGDEQYDDGQYDEDEQYTIVSTPMVVNTVVWARRRRQCPPRASWQTSSIFAATLARRVMCATTHNQAGTSSTTMSITAFDQHDGRQQHDEAQYDDMQSYSATWANKTESGTTPLPITTASTRRSGSSRW